MRAYEQGSGYFLFVLYSIVRLIFNKGLLYIDYKSQYIHHYQMAKP